MVNMEDVVKLLFYKIKNLAGLSFAAVALVCEAHMSQFFFTLLYSDVLIQRMASF